MRFALHLLYLQSFSRSRRSLQLQGKHASVEGQVMELQPLTQHSQQKGYFRQGVSGHLRLFTGRHLALFTLKETRRYSFSKVSTGMIVWQLKPLGNQWKRLFWYLCLWLLHLQVGRISQKISSKVNRQSASIITVAVSIERLSTGKQYL